MSNNSDKINSSQRCGTATCYVKPKPYIQYYRGCVHLSVRSRSMINNIERGNTVFYLLIVEINMMTKPVNIGMLYPILQQNAIIQRLRSVSVRSGSRKTAFDFVKLFLCRISNA